MHFLFVTKEYPPTPDPSGGIVFNLCAELQKQGHHVDVIARGNKSHTEEKFGNIYWVERTFWEKLCRRIDSGRYKKIDVLLHRIFTYLRKMALVFCIHRFPNSEIAMTRRMIRTYNKYLKGQPIDVVVGFFRPYSCLSVAMQIAGGTQHTKCISCYLDLVESKSCPSLMPQQLYEKLINKGDQRVMKNCDFIMLPVSAKRRENLALNYHNGVIYYEFPTLTERQSTTNISTHRKESVGCGCKTIKLVFAGTMNQKYRNPMFMLEALNGMAQIAPEWEFCLDIFGGGDCDNMCRGFDSSSNLFINYHGKVPKEDVLAYEGEADVLINIMNSYEAIVPSKIFELFATGKPILNFVTQADDGSLKYFEKYPLSYTINWNGTSKGDKKRIAEEAHTFVQNNLGNHVESEVIARLYEQCTPRYVVNQIIDAIKEGERK